MTPFDPLLGAGVEDQEYRYECDAPDCGFVLVVNLDGEEFDAITAMARRGTFDRTVAEHEATHR